MDETFSKFAVPFPEVHSACYAIWTVCFYALPSSDGASIIFICYNLLYVAFEIAFRSILVGEIAR